MVSIYLKDITTFDVFIIDDNAGFATSSCFSTATTSIGSEGTSLAFDSSFLWSPSFSDWEFVILIIEVWSLELGLNSTAVFFNNGFFGFAICSFVIVSRFKI